MRQLSRTAPLTTLAPDSATPDPRHETHAHPSPDPQPLDALDRPGRRRLRPLVGTHSADVAIVGGGFVGLWTAITLKQLEPDARVLLTGAGRLRRRRSGWNGGFVMSWWPKIGTLLGFCNEARGALPWQARSQAIQELGEFCARHDIDAHFQRGSWLWTATTARHLDAWNDTLATANGSASVPSNASTPRSGHAGPVRRCISPGSSGAAMPPCNQPCWCRHAPRSAGPRRGNP
ncbi:FAD-dependent oxidoreductase [Pseudomonas aeruginosa]